jgi:nitrogen regulatory protein P-II 1
VGLVILTDGYFCKLIDSLKNGDKYSLQVVVDDDKEKDAIEIIRANSKIGKIFISPITRAIDIESGAENEQAI